MGLFRGGGMRREIGLVDGSAGLYFVGRPEPMSRNAVWYAERVWMARQDRERRAGVLARPAQTVPDKLYFRIGEVARICAVPSYVLRFWEREFPQLRPGKGGTGQRLYRRRDVEMALRVRRLLYEEGYTIPGARQWLRESGRVAGEGGGTEEVAADAAASGARLREMRAELEAIAQMLAGGERRRTGRAAGERERHVGRRRMAEGAGAMPLFEVLEGPGLLNLVEGSEADDE